jgi:hypothetical protein
MATYTINVTIAPALSGILKIGSTTASGNVQEEGVTVNLNATASSGFTFVSFVIDGGSPILTRSHSFVMPATNVALTVNFVAIAVPTNARQADLYDTTCPKFFFVDNLSDRFFTGDLVNLTGYTYTELIEPIGWDAGKFKLERDDTYHGFNYEFGVESLSYERDTVGYEYLQNKLLTQGTDSDVKFLYGFGQPDAFTVFYLGKVDMNEYAEVDDGQYIDFSLVELDFDNLLQTAFTVIQPSTPTESVLLHSKVIPKLVRYDVPTLGGSRNVGRAFMSEDLDISLAGAGFGKEIVAYPSQSIYTKAYLYVNDGKSGDDLEFTPTYDFKVDTNKDYDSIESEQYLIKAEEAGEYKVSVKGTYGLEFRFPADFTAPYPFQLQVIKVATDSVTILSESTFEAKEIEAGIPFLGSYNVALTFDEVFNISLNINESLFVYFLIDVSSPRFPPVTNSTKPTILDILRFPFKNNIAAPNIEILAQTVAPTSVANFSNPLTLLNTVFKKASEVTYDLVVSDFFDVGGCGEKMYITNGFNIRGGTSTVDITDDNALIKVAPKAISDMFVNLFNMGWGVEYNEFKQEVVRFEPSEYFYKNVEILQLDSVSNYTKSIEQAKYYNEIEVGFKNYSKNKETDKGNTLDDFHTKHVYQTPIKTNKNKLSIITDLTLSAYELEILRRKQFIVNGNNKNSNYKEDEEIFGVFISSTQPFLGGVYSIYSETTYTTILNNVLDNYGTGASVLYISSGGVTQSRTLSTVFYSGGDTVLGFVEPVQGGGGNQDLTITVSGSSHLEPEISGKIDASSGLTSPSTSYNLRFTPKRMLQNWANLINGGFIAKDYTEKLIFKQGDGNINLITFYSEGESCRFGDVDRTSVVESGDIMIGTPTEDPTVMSMGQGVFLFLPIKISFSTSLSFEQLTDLKRCLRGQDGIRDYGYITIQNYCGVNEKIYITSLEYSPVTEEAQIEGYLKEL